MGRINISFGAGTGQENTFPFLFLKKEKKRKSKWNERFTNFFPQLNCGSEATVDFPAVRWTTAI